MLRKISLVSLLVAVNCYCGCCWEPLSFRWIMLPLLIILMVLFGAACKSYILMSRCSCCAVLRAPEFHACERQRRKKTENNWFYWFLWSLKIGFARVRIDILQFQPIMMTHGCDGTVSFSHFISCHKFTFQLQKPFTFQSVVGWNKCKYALEMGSVVATFGG